MGAFDYTTNGVTMHAHSGMTVADKDQLIWVNSQHSKTLPNMLKIYNSITSYKTENI